MVSVLRVRKACWCRRTAKVQQDGADVKESAVYVITVRAHLEKADAEPGSLKGCLWSACGESDHCIFFLYHFHTFLYTPLNPKP